MEKKNNPKTEMLSSKNKLKNVILKLKALKSKSPILENLYGPL